MINVFKNRTRLCAVTTSVFFFLQGVDASRAAWYYSFLPSMPSMSFLPFYLPFTGNGVNYPTSGEMETVEKERIE